MANYIGKCFLINGQLIKVTSKYSINPTYKNYYMHEAIIPITKGYGIGYKLSSGAYYIADEDAKQVDLTIWDKTLKLIKLGNSACVIMLANASASPGYTGYTKLIYNNSNIVKVLTDNRSLLITPDHFSILYNHEIDRYLFLRNQVVTITSTANISKDVYEKVYNNIVNTTNEIKKLWT